MKTKALVALFVDFVVSLRIVLFFVYVYVSNKNSSHSEDVEKAAVKPAVPAFEENAPKASAPVVPAKAPPGPVEFPPLLCNGNGYLTIGDVGTSNATLLDRHEKAIRAWVKRLDHKTLHHHVANATRHKHFQQYLDTFPGRRWGKLDAHAEEDLIEFDMWLKKKELSDKMSTPTLPSQPAAPAEPADAVPKTSSQSLPKPTPSALPKATPEVALPKSTLPATPPAVATPPEVALPKPTLPATPPAVATPAAVPGAVPTTSPASTATPVVPTATKSAPVIKRATPLFDEVAEAPTLPAEIPSVGLPEISPAHKLAYQDYWKQFQRSKSTPLLVESPAASTAASATPSPPVFASSSEATPSSREECKRKLESELEKALESSGLREPTYIYIYNYLYIILYISVQNVIHIC